MTTTPTELIDEHCRERGLKRYTSIPMNLVDCFATHRDTAYEKIEEIKAQFIAGKKLKFYVGFADNGELNAHANIKKSVGLLVIFRGAVLLPRDMFLRMLSHPRALCHIGNASLESDMRQPSEGIVENFDELSDRRLREGRPVIPLPPNDPIRLEFAVAASQLVFDFLVLHEIAHVCTGHVERVLLQHTKLDHQAIEWSADNTATGIMLERIFKFGIQTPKKWTAFFSTNEQKLYAWCVAIAGLFRLWGLKTNLADIGSSHEYPPHSMRFAGVLGTARIVVKQINPTLGAQFDGILSKAMQDMGEAMAAIGGPRLSREDLDPLYSAKGRAHHKRVTKRWQKLIPQLRPHACVHLKDPERK